MEYFKTPREILVAQLREIKIERSKAKCRTGIIWQDKDFIECDKVIKQYEDLLKKI